MIGPAPAVAWYGDDFTGSTDVLEVLACAGLDPVLFVSSPSPSALARHSSARAIGIAGVSRARDPTWMDRHLPDAFATLLGLQPSILHYKTCSTFDSSPTIGSIGRALEIGRIAASARGATPVLVGAPTLGRYTAFGHLFARTGDRVVRIDRHPTMSRHPVTPMTEADLALHLGAQTSLQVKLFDLASLQLPDYRERYEVQASADCALIMDVTDEATQLKAGHLLWDGAASRPFCVGSSGIEYALVAAWRDAGLLSDRMPPVRVPSTSAILTVVGSCSPTTARQIAAAESAGHVAVRLDTAPLMGSEPDAAIEAALRAGRAVLARGRSAIIHAALGTDDPMIGVTRAAAHDAGIPLQAATRRIGQALGAIAASLLREGRLRRFVVAGGDTSGEVIGALDIEALTMIAPFAPGSPLCRIHTGNRRLDGLEVILKGGQVGGEGLLEDVRMGRSSHTQATRSPATEEIIR